MFFADPLKFRKLQNAGQHGAPGSVHQAQLRGGILLVIGGKARCAVVIPTDMIPWPDREPTEEELKGLREDGFQAWADSLEERFQDDPEEIEIDGEPLE